MGFDVSSLVDYVDQTSEDLIARSYFENRSAAFFAIQTGIKKSAAIQLLNVVATAQADTACSFNADGSTTFTQRDITVGPIKYQDILCMKDLRAKWTQVLLMPGSNAENETVTFEQDITDQLINLIKEDVETADWQGDTAGASGDILDRYDGLIKIIDAATTAIDGNTGAVTVATGITSGASGNADTLVYAMCDARPAKLKTKPGLVLFVGTDVYDKFVDTLIQKNNFHIDATTPSDYTMPIPGRNCQLVGVHGLDATDRMFLARSKENIVLGVDLENEEEDFRLWYSMDDDNIKYSIKFKRGVQVAYPNEIVEFTLVP